MPGVRTARGAGEPYPYVVPFTQAQLVTMLPGINLYNKLPVCIVDINGLRYRTLQDLDAGTYGPQIGQIVPLGPPRPSVIGPKKVGDTFVDRAAVYWDPVNSQFTSSSGGSNWLAGYAVSNPQLGSGTNGTASAIAYGIAGTGQGTSTANLTEYNAVCTITGGTSADGQVGSYAAADTSIEVELVGPVSTVTNNQTGQSTNIVADPGTAAEIVVTSGGTCELTIAASGETRGLPAPTFDGQRMMLNIKGFTASATAKVALGAAHNATPSGTVDGTNKFVTFNAFGQGCLLEGIPASASTYKWMLIANLGSTLSAS
jgi:hypothetical protein